jgi:DNA-binding response OmpR family regulator
MACPSLIVAEDDPAMRRWLVTVLTPIAGRIHTATDGWQVWNTLIEEEIDLVISDIQMPMKNGLDTLNLVRVAGIRVPFLLITGFGGDEVRVSAAALGAEVLDKPFAAAELLGHVRRICGPLA